MVMGIPAAGRLLPSLILLTCATWNFHTINLALARNANGQRGVGTMEAHNASQPVWERAGDMQLGIVLSMTTFHKDRLCGPILRQPSALHRLHAMVFALEEINRRQDLLPNVTLGFVVMDDCSRDGAALLRALRFIRNPACEVHDDLRFRDSALSASPFSYRSYLYGHRQREEKVKSYPVVGLIGAELSESSMQMAALLSAFRVPQLSYASSSPFLSDKNKYGFFSRIVPSDRQQALVIVDILHQFRWTYVAVIYSYGVYGLSGFRYIRNALSEKGFCLASAMATESEHGDADYDSLVDHLDGISPKVRVVVLFTIHASNVMRAAQRRGLAGRFVLVSSDALVPNAKDFKGFEDIAMGLLLVTFNSAPVKRFEDVFQYTTLRNSSRGDPWFAKFYSSMFQCSVAGAVPSRTSLSAASSLTSPPPCDKDVPLLRSPLFEKNASVMRAFHSVYAFAYALDKVVRSCGHYTRQNVSDCFTPEELLHSLRGINFVGENNVSVAFDEAGDGLSSYQVRNFQKDPHRGGYRFLTVGEWDGRTQNFTFLDKEAITWPSRRGPREQETRDSDRGQEVEEEEDEEGVPKSTCTEACSVGQEALSSWPRCCWVCKTCRENEITITQDGLPTCVACPSEENFTWPDPTTRTRCEDIPVDFVSFSSSLGMTLLTVDLLVFLLVLICTVLYVRHRHNRLIKATSRELSGVMLGGHFLACVAVPVFLVEPSVGSCLVSQVLFHVSLTLVYAPLLVKINRIYRIFVSGKRSARTPLFIGSGFQLAVSLFAVLVHLLFIITWMSLNHPKAETRMPSFSQKYVELVCIVSEAGFLSSLVINLVLMVACAVHSLTTRQLPANFNEAKFITICIYTIAVVWLSFLATYFVMANGAVHTLCLALALLVNVISCQVFLFIPKLYAVLKLPSSKLHVVNVTTGNAGSQNEPKSDAPLQ